jgi:hypothetical protein
VPTLTARRERSSTRSRASIDSRRTAGSRSRVQSIPQDRQIKETQRYGD